MPATKNEKELPSTIQRSDAKAKRTWAKAHDSAVETYGEGQQAHRTAYSAFEHVRGRSRMNKGELAGAIASKQRQADRRKR